MQRVHTSKPERKTATFASAAFGRATWPGSALASRYYETARVTEESVSLYSSNEDRPYFIDVDVQLRPKRHVSLTSWLLLTVTLAATLAAAFVSGPDLVDRLGVLAIPTTLAAAVLLVREQTPLSFRLQRLSRLGLGCRDRCPLVGDDRPPRLIVLPSIT
jgi:hypothetical protein